MINTLFGPTLEWIRNDYESNRFRFVMELFAWIISIGCSITMAGTVPNPPLVALYPAWITGCAIYAWCAWSRRSFGMLANYLLLVAIDLVGFSRIIFN
jgi:hypothetical protein